MLAEKLWINFLYMGSLRGTPLILDKEGHSACSGLKSAGLSV